MMTSTTSRTKTPKRGLVLGAAALLPLLLGSFALAATDRTATTEVAEVSDLPASTTTPPSGEATTVSDTAGPVVAATPGPRPTTTTKARPAPTTTTVGTAEPRSGQQAVTAFTAAVDSEDSVSAWRLLSSRSQAHWGNRSAFAGAMPKLAQGGYGRWTKSADRKMSSTVIASSGDGEILVVTVRGTRSDGGPGRYQAQAFPVRHVKGTFRLELFDLGPGDTVPALTGPNDVVDATMTTSDRRPTFQARAKGEEVHWSLDGREATITNVSGRVAGYQPETALSRGAHVLTLASIGQGWLTATAVVVDVT